MTRRMKREQQMDRVVLCFTASQVRQLMEQQRLQFYNTSGLKANWYYSERMVWEGISNLICT